MGDSDEDESSTSNFQLTSILFGNIDESGQLEDDILDKESKRHLASLARLGLSSIINELIDDAELASKSNIDYQQHDSVQSASVDHGSEDYDVKSPSAVDYSDINELADDSHPESYSKPIKSEVDNTDYDADDEGPNIKGDNQLMPPPPQPENGRDDESEDPNKKLETPLAAMLPSKYAGVDVRELFPDFRHDKVVGWGGTENCAPGSSCPVSDTLLYSNVSVMSYQQCADLMQNITGSATLNHRLTDDKVCSGNGSLSVVQRGDSGGGLVLPFKGKFFIQGVVSNKISDYMNKFVFSAYTNVGQHVVWIQEMLSY